MTNQSDFNAADNVLHPVEKEYHYKLLTKYGFTSESSPQKGFVRHYEYTKNDIKVIVYIGASCDYYEGSLGFGYMSNIEEVLKV